MLRSARFANSKEALEESLELLNHGFFLPGSGAAEAGDRRHQLIDVGAGGFDLAVAEGVSQEVPAALIQAAGVLAVLLVQNAVRLFLVGAIAVDHRHPQFFAGSAAICLWNSQ